MQNNLSIRAKIDSARERGREKEMVRKMGMESVAEELEKVKDVL